MSFLGKMGRMNLGLAYSIYIEEPNPKLTPSSYDTPGVRQLLLSIIKNSPAKREQIMVFEKCERVR